MLSFIVVGFVLLIDVGYASLPTGRVVNGTNSDIERYPFMVSMRGPTNSHSCGGSIVSSRFVLTAAHCVTGRRVNDLTIQYGLTVINSAGPNVVRVKRIIQHEDYNPAQSHANDIALIEVEKPFPIDNKIVALVLLPELGFQTPQVDEGADGILTGWGLNATGGVIMNHLQEVNLKIYSDKECSYRHNGVVTSKQICGGIDDGGKGQCSGDSGGPLLYNSIYQVGVVSWSIKPCTVAPYPGVYTKVSHYIDWIKRNMIIQA